MLLGLRRCLLQRLAGSKFRTRCKPDYLVGIPGLGLVAFDLKANTLYDGEILFGVDEVEKLRSFSHLFHLTVYFACLDPGARGTAFGCVWTSSTGSPPHVAGLASYSRSRPTGDAGSLSEPFYAAFVQAVALA